MECDCKDWSLLGLRVVIAAIMLFYGVPKLISLGDGYFFGLPGIIGLLVGIAEVAAAILILAGGKWFKWSNYTVVAIMIVATLWVVGPEKGWFSADLQRNLLIIAGAEMLASAGPGNMAMKA